jgi:hypothetical protein
VWDHLGGRDGELTASAERKRAGGSGWLARYREKKNKEAVGLVFYSSFTIFSYPTSST